MNRLRPRATSGRRGQFPQDGFIPMMLCIIAVIAFIIYLVYTRVASMPH